jgi:ATP-dependent helicase HrpB
VGHGKILVLEPRRIAARAAADRWQRTRGGAHRRHGRACGALRLQGVAKTRIEVVTEGVFTRLILDDPELKGIRGRAVREFHERSLDADLGLALARDAQLGLREDLKIS